jgi:hypothetical protein
MKKTLIVMALGLAAFSAQANCPNYTGKYLCSGDGIEQEMNLKTEIVDGKYQYTLDDAVVVADGVTRPVDFQGGIYDIAATCSANDVTVKVLFPGGEGDNEACGAEKWNLLYTLSFSPAGTNINETHYSEAICESGKVIPTEERGTLSCVPVQ